MYKRIIVALTATLAVACAPLRSPSLSSAPEYSALQPQRDSFVVLKRGRPVGFQRTNLERTDIGYRLLHELQVDGAASQATEVEFSIDGGGDSVTQRDGAGLQQTHLKLTYADEATLGTMLDGVDDNLVALLIPTLPWASGARYLVTTTYAESGTATSYALTAIGSQRVTVPSGTFDTFVVELMGANSRPLLLNVTATRPYRIVRIVPAGQRLEFVLASSSRGAR